MAGIDPQRKALIDVLNQKEQERLAQQPPPSPLSQALGAVTKPFQGYWDRQGQLAREGLAMADQGSQQVRGGDLSGLAGMLLGPLGYVSSPINALLPEEQTTRDFGRSVGGKFGEAAAAGGLGLASMMLPGPKGMAKLPSPKPSLAEGITAYHGSPHTFDRFDMSKIGTGEGAQAYGHGLYFAENEAVAKGYRDTLTKSGNGGAQKRLQQAGGDVDKAIADSRAKAEKYRSGGADTYASAIEEDLRFLEDYKRTGSWVPGATYQVRLNVKPDELLDWDRPLSEQPQTIRDALKTAGAVGPKHSDWSMPGGKVLENMKTDPAFAADMRKQGVKGIRYKDAGSRDKDGGTYNYVIFDDKLVDILKRYAIPFTLGAGGAAMVSGQDMPDEVAAQLGPQA